MQDAYENQAGQYKLKDDELKFANQVVANETVAKAFIKMVNSLHYAEQEPELHVIAVTEFNLALATVPLTDGVSYINAELLKGILLKLKEAYPSVPPVNPPGNLRFLVNAADIARSTRDNPFKKTSQESAFDSMRKVAMAADGYFETEEQSLSQEKASWMKQIAQLEIYESALFQLYYPDIPENAYNIKKEDTQERIVYDRMIGNIMIQAHKEVKDESLIPSYFDNNESFFKNCIEQKKQQAVAELKDIYQVLLFSNAFGEADLDNVLYTTENGSVTYRERLDTLTSFIFEDPSWLKQNPKLLSDTGKYLLNFGDVFDYHPNVLNNASVKNNKPGNSESPAELCQLAITKARALHIMQRAKSKLFQSEENIEKISDAISKVDQTKDRGEFKRVIETLEKLYEPRGWIFVLPNFLKKWLFGEDTTATTKTQLKNIIQEIGSEDKEEQQQPDSEMPSPK